MANAREISEAVERLKGQDPTLQNLMLFNSDYTDDNLTELIDCLMAYPNAVKRIFLDDNHLTDETGIKIAQYLAISNTINTLSFIGNQFGEKTYLAMAMALRVNTSLNCLFLYNNQAVTQNWIDGAMIDTLILNPNRPGNSGWFLYSSETQDFNRLKTVAEELGHPSMQAVLAME